MNFFTGLLVFYTSLSFLTGCANASTKTSVETDYGDETREGLKHVNDRVVIFLNAYNQEHKTNWRSLEPDLRIMVYKCLNEIKTRWTQKVPDVIGINNSLWYVKSSCNKTAGKTVKSQQWIIYVPTTRPK